MRFTQTLAAVSASALLLVACGTGSSAGAAEEVTTDRSESTAPPVRIEPQPISSEDALNKIPACGQAVCTLMDRQDGFTSSDGAASVFLVTTSDTWGQPGEIDGHLYVVSNNGNVVWSEPENSAYRTGNFGASGNTNTVEDKIYTDDSGNAIVQIAVGAHSMNFLVLDISSEGVRDFDSFNAMDTTNPSPFFGGAPGLVVDKDGNGTYELVVMTNDYLPSYAGGTYYDTVWSWNGADYVVTDCGKQAAGGERTSYPPTNGACAIAS